MEKTIEVIDLFAGPGGLGEGFSGYRDQDGNFPFKILASAEMNPSAHRTLSLRALYRRVTSKDDKNLVKTYRGVLKNLSENTTLDPAILTEKTNLEEHWEQVKEEALCVKLGTHEGNNRLGNRLKSINRNNPLVLIGGPPCQAYSLAGRSRNRGKIGYKPEEDDRHFLYKQYLQILVEHQPDIFIMENVKGMLSSSVGGRKICEQIFEDLRNPAKSGKKRKNNNLRYMLYSLVESSEQEEDENYFQKQFVIHAENYGIPQCRHRVIILGLREDKATQWNLQIGKLTPALKKMTTQDAIRDLPAIRSGITGRKTTNTEWAKALSGRQNEVKEIVRELNPGIWEALNRLKINNKLNQNSNKYEENLHTASIRKRYRLDMEEDLIFNHEARNHMESDLARYLFCSTFGRVYGRSPTSSDFPKALAPKHKNWAKGIFADRFRVQLAERPSSTVVSHIAKDGHAFIHYDEAQCRSLTVREAARLQTFPDDYLFLGSRTEQYGQVGNAVPVQLARQIASVVYGLISST